MPKATIKCNSQYKIRYPTVSVDDIEKKLKELIKSREKLNESKLKVNKTNVKPTSDKDYELSSNEDSFDHNSLMIQEKIDVEKSKTRYLNNGNTKQSLINFEAYNDSLIRLP